MALTSEQTVSDRARDAAKDAANFGHRLNSAIPGHHAATIQRPRGIVPHTDAAPSQATAQIPVQIDSEASGEARFYHSSDLLPTNIYVHSDSWSKKIRKQLGDDMKPNVTTLVEKMYNFKTSQALASLSYNTRRAQELLRQMNFVFPVRLRP